jgi:hypothetical protein
MVDLFLTSFVKITDVVRKDFSKISEALFKRDCVMIVDSLFRNIPREFDKLLTSLESLSKNENVENNELLRVCEGIEIDNFFW